MGEISVLHPDMIRQSVSEALRRLLEQTACRPGDFVVIGCSSSEIIGKQIGSVGSLEAAQAVYDGVMPVLRERGCILLPSAVNISTAHWLSNGRQRTPGIWMRSMRFRRCTRAVLLER